MLFDPVGCSRVVERAAFPSPATRIPGLEEGSGVPLPFPSPCPPSPSYLPTLCLPAGGSRQLSQNSCRLERARPLAFLFESLKYRLGN